MRLNLYAQNRHVVIIDGVPVSGFAEGDFIQIDVDGNAAERSQGADGPTMNISTKQGGNITIGLMPTSPAIGTLYAIRDQQQNTPRMFRVIVVSGVEEIVNAGGCAFGKLPSFSTGGPKMQPRNFAIECLEIKMDTSAVEAISGGVVGGLL